MRLCIGEDSTRDENVGINALASENDGNGLEGISSKEVLKQL
jgi:hypothetical protein